MKKYFTKIISVLLAAFVFTAVLPFGASASNDESTLKFGSDGKFKIVQFADTQDDAIPREAMIMFIKDVLEDVRPDLVVLTGDNTGAEDTKLLSKLAIQAMLKPIADSGVPFTFVFGNHDAENVKKEYQLGVYQSYDNCLAYDADASLTGCGTHNLEILSSNGARTAFNLWLVDSNMYDEERGGYDHVHPDQLEWYKNTSAALASKNGGKLVPSLVFQHICVPETYELLLNADTEDPSLTRSYLNTRKILKLDPSKATGNLNEWPCPPSYNSGELDTFAETGDVLGIVTGHDHVNSFIGTVKGIDLIQTQGIGFQTYGNELRGFRVITLDEDDAWNYETYTESFFEFYGDTVQTRFMYDYLGSEIASFVPDFIDKMLIDFVCTDIGVKIYNYLAVNIGKISALFD